MPKINPSTRAFTLLELLIAASIFSVVILTLYIAFNTGVFGQRNIDKNIELNRAGEYIFRQLNLDLRNSFAYASAEAKFSGDKTSCSFLTLKDTFNPEKKEMQTDYALLSYKLAGDKLLRLCRKNKDSLNEKSETPFEKMPAYIKEFTLEYGVFDVNSGEIEYQDFWDNTKFPGQLPHALKIKLILEDKDKEIQKEFKRTIFLPLAG